MFGISYLKVPSTTYVILYKNGKIVRSGPGLSFFYFAPTSTIIKIPLSSIDIPFVFNEFSSDFQEVTIQGNITFRIQEPEKLAQLLDYSVDQRGNYRSDDPDKLSQRLVQAAQVHTRSFAQSKMMQELLVSSEALVTRLAEELRQSTSLSRLGVDLMEVSILAVTSHPEMAKALQAEAREKLLRQADEAIYARRNVSVELERAIRENELQTEIAVATKQRQVRETQMTTEIALEEQRKTLVASQVDNEKLQAQARAEALRAMLEPVKNIDWRTLIAAHGASPGMLMSMAFEELAQNAGKIGELNISPDLLSTILKQQRTKGND